MKLVTSPRLIGLELFTDSEQVSRKDALESSSEIYLRDCGKEDRKSFFSNSTTYSYELSWSPLLAVAEV